MTLPATAPPLSTAGHTLLSNGPQENVEGSDTRKSQTEVTNMEDQGGDKVFLCANIYTSFSVSPCHTHAAAARHPPQLSPSLFLPVSGKSPPSQNTCKRIKLGCTLVVALTDQRQDPCFNLSRYKVPCVFQNFSCITVLATGTAEH